jgi:nucleobase:cation symporter-1, NCS1 family
VTVAARTQSDPTPPADPRLYNADLAPAEQRRWKSLDIVFMWMSDVHNLGNYTFAAGLFVLGMSAWQVFTALLAGFVVIYLGMNLMGRIGQTTGVPFPVVARISFGVFGANLPALIRAIIAIFWYGIQTYLASVAMIVLLLAVDPGLKPLTEHGFLGLSALGWICFLVLWALQALVISRGMETVRKFQDFCGPAIWVVMLALAVWVLAKAHWNISLTTSPTHLSAGQQVNHWFAAAGLILSTYGTLMLNFGDFSRFTPDLKTVRRGNFWGLPINSTAFALVSVIVTAGSVQVFGQAITDPAALIAKIGNTPVLIVGALTFAVATMGVNIVANFVSPAYDLANIWPKRITFKVGGMISTVVALCVLPWKLYSSPAVVNYFLGGLGAFLGPLFGIMIVDYYLIKRGKIEVAALFDASADAPYHYRKGVNPKALVAFVPTAALTAVLALAPAFAAAAPYSWFIGTGTAGLLYFAINRQRRIRTE